MEPKSESNAAPVHGIVMVLLALILIALFGVITSQLMVARILEEIYKVIR